jgi:hypothetical protein
VHGHAEAERVNSVAFHELREWSKDVERGGGVGGSARRLRFFVRRSGEEGAVSAVSAALPSPAAARRSRDPLVLLRPLLVAAGLAEKGAGGGEECYFEDDGEGERRSGAQPPPSTSFDDVDDSLLASLRDPAAFFAAALRASRARRAAAAARAASPVVLDASRRRAARKIVRGIAVRYGQGFSSSSSSSSSGSPPHPPPPEPEEVARQVRRLAETVEDFLGRLEEGEDEDANNPLSGSTILLVKRKRTTESEQPRGSSSGVDLLSGSVSLDVSDDTQSWLEILGEASDPARGAAALRGAAGRRAEAEAHAAAALGVDSISLSRRRLFGKGEEDLDERTLSHYDSLVRELASAAPASCLTRERRHAGVAVVVAAAAAPPSSSVGTITVGLKDSPSALSVFSDVESAAPAATSELLELRRAEAATRKLLQAAATKLGVSSGELRRGGDESAEEEGLLTPAEAAAAAARILRAPDSSRIAGSAKGFRALHLGKCNAVSRDGERVTLGVDFEV